MVKICRPDANRKPTTVATAELTREGVALQGEARVVKMLEDFKVRAADGTIYSKADGQPWLDALPRNLIGTYLWAERGGSYNGIAKLDWNPLDHPRDALGRFIRTLGGDSGKA